MLERTILSGCTEIFFLPVSRKTDGIHVRRFSNPNFGCDTVNASTLKFSAKNTHTYTHSLFLFRPLVTAHGNEEPDASVHFSLSYGPLAINLPPFEIEGDRERNLFADLLFIVAHCPVPERTRVSLAQLARTLVSARSLDLSRARFAKYSRIADREPEDSAHVSKTILRM